MKIDGTLKIDSQKNLLINSSKGISLNVGCNFITINADGIFLNGKEVNLNSGGKLVKVEDVPIVTVKQPTDK